MATILLFSGGRYKNWKRRWFILNDSCLYYFQFTTVSSYIHINYRVWHYRVFALGLH